MVCLSSLRLTLHYDVLTRGLNRHFVLDLLLSNTAHNLQFLRLDLIGKRVVQVQIGKLLGDFLLLLLLDSLVAADEVFWLDCLAVHKGGRNSDALLRVDDGLFEFREGLLALRLLFLDEVPVGVFEMLGESIRLLLRGDVEVAVVSFGVFVRVRVFLVVHSREVFLFDRFVELFLLLHIEVLGAFHGELQVAVRELVHVRPRVVHRLIEVVHHRVRPAGDLLDGGSF